MARARVGSRKARSDSHISAKELIGDIRKTYEDALKELERKLADDPRIRELRKLSRKEVEEALSDGPSIPAELFSDRRAGILEISVLYLSKQLSNKAISRILDRDERTISTSLRNAKKKIATLPDTGRSISIPASILSDRDMGPLEAVVRHLRKDLSQRQIADFLNRDERTISKTARCASAKKKDSEDMSFSAMVSRLAAPAEQQVPLEIFRDRRLGVLESLVRYLTLDGLSNKEISGLTNRDERTIWATCHKAKAKAPDILSLPEKTAIQVPVSIFTDRRLGALEALVEFLRSKDMRYRDIARLLERDERTIWTAASRAGKKKHD